MKKRVGLVGILFLLSLMVVPVGPSMAVSLAYDSCFDIQNLSDTEVANLVIMYFQQGDTTPVASPGAVLDAGGKQNFCPLLAVSGGFNGSVVIESNQPIAAIVNVTGDGWKRYNASYIGFAEGATESNLPLLHFNNFGWYSWYNVQNVGGGDAHVDVTYSDGLTLPTTTIKPNLSKTFDQKMEAHTLSVFAAKVTSDEPIVVTVMQVGPAGYPMLLGYNGFTQQPTMPVIPTIMGNNFGFTSSINIQNTGGGSTTVTVTYTPSTDGTACTQTKTIAAGAVEIFAKNAWDSGDVSGDNTCVNGEMFVGSAAVTANSGAEELAAVVNIHQFTTKKGSAYSAFDPANGTSKVVMPLIMDGNYGYWTGFNIMNVGSAQTTVSCTFTGSTYTTGPDILQPGEAVTHNQNGTPLAPLYKGSAICTATGGDALIAAVVNELRSGGVEDTLLTYEAINAP